MSSSSSSHTLTLVPKDVEREIKNYDKILMFFFRVQEKTKVKRERDKHTKQYVNCMHRKVPESRPLAQHAGIRIRCL